MSDPTTDLELKFMPPPPVVRAFTDEQIGALSRALNAFGTALSEAAVAYVELITAQLEPQARALRQLTEALRDARGSDR